MSSSFIDVGTIIEQRKIVPTCVIVCVCDLLRVMMILDYLLPTPSSGILESDLIPTKGKSAWVNSS